MKNLTFSVCEDRTTGRIFKEDPNFSEHNEMGSSDWVEKFYDLVVSYPEYDENCEFPSINLYEKKPESAVLSEIENPHPEYLAIFCTPTRYQTVTLYNIVDLYALIKEFDIIISRSENKYHIRKTDKQFNDMIKKSREF